MSPAERTILALAIMGATAFFTLAATAQPITPGAGPRSERAEREAAAPSKIRTDRVKRRWARYGYGTRMYPGGPADICYTINGWRAFPTRDPRGYFYTGRCY
jgi:hypothetical protein